MTLPSWVWVILGYALGSIPFGYLLTRLFTGEDVRNTGSGVTGATNVSRRLGPWGGLATMLLDAGKGALAVVLAQAFAQDSRWTALAGLAAVLGHCYPVFLDFRGGKAVATALGVFLIACPPAVGVAAVLFILVIWTTRYVSLGSLLAAAVFPILYWLFHGPESGVVASSCTAVLIIWRHRDNIRRLMSGTERKFSLRRKA